MHRFINPPSSQKRLERLIKDVYQKTFKGVCTTIITFPGAGFTSELRYLARYLGTHEKYKDGIITFLDLKLLKETEESAFRECLSYIKINYDSKLSDEMLAEFDAVLLRKTIKLDAFLNILHKITYSFKLKLTVVVDSLFPAYKKSGSPGKLSEFLLTIKKVNPMNVSLVFMASAEFDDSAIPEMGRLTSYFIENVIYGKDLMFDEISAQRLLSNQEVWKNITFSPLFKSKVSTLSKYDPSVIRLIATQAIDDRMFENNFISEADIAKVYTLVGNDRLDYRYGRIIEELNIKSLEYLIQDSSNPTQFLVNSGLVVDGIPLNPLFEYYCHKNREKIAGIIELMDKKGSTIDELNEKLSSQELAVYRLFEGRAGVLVSRDEIAAAMWGDKSEQSYSDWAIDQLISRLRCKIKNLGYGGTLKSVKGKGLMLLK